MSSDFNFTVKSWFLGNVRVKPYFNTQCLPPRFRRPWNRDDVFASAAFLDYAMTFVSLSPPLLDFRLWKAFSSAKMWIFFPASSAKKMEQKESLHHGAKSSGSIANRFFYIKNQFYKNIFLIQLSPTFTLSVKKGQSPFLELSKFFWNKNLLVSP